MAMISNKQSILRKKKGTTLNLTKKKKKSKDLQTPEKSGNIENNFQKFWRGSNIFKKEVHFLKAQNAWGSFFSLDNMGSGHNSGYGRFCSF